MIIQVVCSLIAKHHIEATRSISGACVLVGAGSYENAAEALVRGNDIDTAFALTSCFIPHERWAVRMRQTLLYALSIRAQGLEDRLQSLELMKLAASIRSDHSALSAIIDVELYAALLASDVGCSEEERARLLSMGGVLKTERELVQEALDEDKRPQADMVRVVRSYLLALRHADAVEVLLRKGDGLLELLSQEWHTWKELEPCKQQPPELLLVITSLVHHVNGLILSDTIQKRKLVGWACWLGGWIAEVYSATWAPGLCLQGIAAALYRRARCIGMSGPSQHALLLAEAGCIFRDAHRVDRGRAVQAENLIAKASQLIVRKDEIDVKIIESAGTWANRHMKQQADAAEEAAALVSPQDRNELIDNVIATSPCSILLGHANPSGSPVPYKNIGSAKSVLDEGFIAGPVVILEDGESVVAAGDAVMWNWLNPFSPLASGERLFVL